MTKFNPENPLNHASGWDASPIVERNQSLLELHNALLRDQVKAEALVSIIADPLFKACMGNMQQTLDQIRFNAINKKH